MRLTTVIIMLAGSIFAGSAFGASPSTEAPAKPDVLAYESVSVSSGLSEDVAVGFGDTAFAEGEIQMTEGAACLDQLENAYNSCILETGDEDYCYELLQPWYDECYAEYEAC